MFAGKWPVSSDLNVFLTTFWQYIFILAVCLYDVLFGLTFCKRNGPTGARNVAARSRQNNFSKGESEYSNFPNSDIILLLFSVFSRAKEVKEGIWLGPVTKASKQTENSRKQNDNTKTPPKSLIRQLLKIRRPVWVMAVTQLVWLNWFRGSNPSH